MLSRGCLYYTDNNPKLPDHIANWCRQSILSSIGDMPLVSVSLKPIDFGTNIVLPLERGYLTLFTQILTGLEALDTDWVFFCEHDNAYPPSHFEFNPPEEKIYYNNNWWKIRDDGFAVHWEADQVSGMCGPRQMLIDWYKKRIETFDSDSFDRKFEPYSGEGAEKWMSSIPYLDIRGKWNLTMNKWEMKHFRKKETAVNFQEGTIKSIPGWNLQSIL